MRFREQRSSLFKDSLRIPVQRAIESSIKKQESLEDSVVSVIQSIAAVFGGERVYVSADNSAFLRERDMEIYARVALGEITVRKAAVIYRLSNRQVQMIMRDEKRRRGDD